MGKRPGHPVASVLSPVIAVYIAFLSVAVPYFHLMPAMTALRETGRMDLDVVCAHRGDPFWYEVEEVEDPNRGMVIQVSAMPPCADLGLVYGFHGLLLGGLILLRRRLRRR